MCIRGDDVWDELRGEVSEMKELMGWVFSFYSKTETELVTHK